MCVLIIFGVMMGSWNNNHNIMENDKNMAVVSFKEEKVEQQRYNTIPDNSNSIPLVKTCLNKTNKAANKIFNQPSCGKPLSISATAASNNFLNNIMQQKNNDGTMMLERLIQECNNFATNGKQGSPTNELLQTVHLRQALDDECWSLLDHVVNVKSNKKKTHLFLMIIVVPKIASWIVIRVSSFHDSWSGIVNVDY